MAQAQNGAPVLITQNVDENQLVTLAGNTRPEANAQNDRGAVPGDLVMEHMLLQLKRSPQQEQKLEQFIEQLQTPSSPNYHHWLTAKQFGARFGLAAQDINSLTRWLQSHGLTVNVVYENGTLVDFSGTAAQVQSAFHTEIHQLEVKGVKHFANMSDPRIPAALAPAVVGLVSLHDFKPHTMYKPRANYTFESGGSTYEAVVPGDLATIYNLNPLFSASTSGQGQTIVVIEDSDVYSTADWTTFRSTFGLSSYTDGSFTQIHPAPKSGTNNCTDPGLNSDEGEAIVDAEYASAAAPSAAIQLASCADTETTFGGLIAIQNLLSENTPPAIMSLSYGECEAGNGSAANLAYSDAYQQGAAEGVSIFVSAGDEGAASCDASDANGGLYAVYGIGISGFASTPYNVAVGGTDFGDTYAGTNSTYWSSTNSTTYESALSYVPEIPWNDSCASVLGATYGTGSGLTYGTNGFCNSETGENYLTVTAGSGGPSGCATGTPAVGGVVGGTCAGWPKPSWQSLVGNPADSVRDIPDVSLFAGNGIWRHFYVFCWSDPDYYGNENGGGADPCTGAPEGWSGAGGTSFASPIMAGIQALVNQKTGSSQGNPNPVYYSLAAAEYGADGSTSCNSTLGNTVASSCVFYDVTLGDMDVDCTGTHNCYLPSGTYGVLSTSDSLYQLAYGTTTGWDFATGIGTVNATNLVNNWPGSLPATTTTLTSSLNPANVGASVTFTATVSTTGSNPPTGTVTFYNGSTSLGAETLGTVGGAQVATLTTSSLPAGSDSITAVYGGDSNNAGSTSSVLIQVINGDSTTTALTSSLNPAGDGVQVTFTAKVTTTGTHVPTGTVSFENGGVIIPGTNPVTLTALNGTQSSAAITTSTLPVGTDSITAVYSGDANNAGSTSNTVSQVIQAPTFTFSVEPTAPAAVLSGGFTTSTFTLTPGGGTFAQNVTFACNGLPDSTVTCSFSPTQIAAGAGATQVTLKIQTTGPNSDVQGGIRRRADNRSPVLPLALPLAGIVAAGFAGRKFWRHSAWAGLGVSLLLLGLLIACGSSNNTPPITITVSPSAATLYPNDAADSWPPQTATFTATVTNTNNSAVTWAVTTANGGTINSSGVYTAPTIAAGLPTTATIMATSQADTTKTATAVVNITPTTVPGTYSGITVTATEGPTANTSSAISLTVN
jgi:subtilase family serine protease